MQDFIQAIADEHVYLFDGAMGTMLYSKGVFINKCYDELNVRNPEIVLEVHRQYVRAGAEILETNTYGANRVKLRSFGIEEELRDINIAAVEIARKAAGDSVYVAGAIGPLGIRIEPYGPTGLEEARDYFREQAEALRDGGVDLIIIETISNVAEVEQAILAVRDVCTLPIVAQMTIGNDHRTIYGDTPATIARRMDAAGADVVGLNCSVGPDVMLDAVEEMSAVTAKKISCQPNAGLPREVNGRQMYMASPEYMGKYAKRLIHKGVKFLGGCCGTTPEHIKIMRDAVRPLSPKRSFVVIERDVSAKKNGGVEPVPMAARSNWGRKIAVGEFVTTIEITPPKGPNPEAMIKSVQSIKDAGVDAVNVPDGPRAQNRMGAIAVAVLLHQRVGIEPVLHYCCRDRNLLGMHSDLLGCAALGLRNMLLITGDPPKMGPYPDATAVFDIDSELRRLDWKIKAGAEYAITQPVFDARQLEHFLKRIEGWKLPIVPGIWPLLSWRN